MISKAFLTNWVPSEVFLNSVHRNSHSYSCSKLASSKTALLCEWQLIISGKFCQIYQENTIESDHHQPFPPIPPVQANILSPLDYCNIFLIVWWRRLMTTQCHLPLLPWWQKPGQYMQQGNYFPAALEARCGHVAQFCPHNQRCRTDCWEDLRKENELALPHPHSSCCLQSAPRLQLQRSS